MHTIAFAADKKAFNFKLICPADCKQLATKSNKENNRNFFNDFYGGKTCTKLAAISGMALALKTYITLIENHDKILSEAIQV